MLCKYCRADINVLANHCPHCGTSQSLLDSGSRPAPGQDSLLDAVSRQIDREVAGLEWEFMDLESSPSQRRASSPATIKPPTFSALARPDHAFLDTAASATLVTPGEEILQIGAFVFHSAHVQANALYRERAAATSLALLDKNHGVNAFATDHPHPSLPFKPPFIALLGGMINAVRLTSLALSYDRTALTVRSNKVFKNTVKAIGREIVASRARFSPQRAYKVFQAQRLAGPCADTEVLRRARSYGAAMNMSVIAHELGHIALGHTLGNRVNLEISRNQEREADSFAASVASSCPFSDYTVAGGVFWWVIMSWVDAVAGNKEGSTHPGSRERLMDYIRANRDQAAALGIDEGNIGEFLP